jgi:large subunit ribosomal protein L21
MFEEWLKFWRRWMFWWVPGVDTADDDKKDTAAPQQSAPQQAAPQQPQAGAADASASRQPASSEAPASSAAADDLTAIKGIGPAIARKLDALGVRTFAELAAADPDDLAARLDSRTVTADRVRTWASEAKKRA